MSIRPVLAVIASMLTLALATGCDPEPRTTATPSPSTDKSSLYGDATLLPSRAGEMARAELAVSGEVERVLGARPDVQSVVASQNGDELVVVAVVEPGVDSSELRALAQPLVSPGVTVSVQAVHDEAPPNTRRGLPLVLGIALLGLGLSAGIWVERYRSTRKRPGPIGARRRR